MKKVLIILLCFILIFAFVGCTNTTSTELLLGRKWSNTNIENFTYEVTDSEGNKGTFIQSIQKVTSADIGNLSYDDITAYLLSSSLIFDGNTINESVLFSSIGKEEGFPPMASYRTSFIDNKYSTEQIEYKENTAYCTVSETDSISEDAKANEISISYPYYDNQQLYTIIRASDISSKLTFAFGIYIPIEKTVVKLNSKYTNTENVVTKYEVDGQAQSYDCNKITIARKQKISGASNFAYYASSNIIVGDYEFQQVLVKFIEADCTYLLKNIEII